MRRRDGYIVRKTVVQFGDIIIDTQSKKITVNNTVIEFSPKEYALIELLIENRGKVVTREYIYETIWGDEYDIFSNTLDTVNVHIAYIRKKLGGTNIIRTVKLSGYIIDLES